MKDKDEEMEKEEEEHQKLVSRMIASAEGAGRLHKSTKPTVWRGGVQMLEGLERDATTLKICE